MAGRRKNEVELNMVKWRKFDRGDGASATLADGLVISCGRELQRLEDGEPTYNVTVFGVRLQGRAMTKEDAQRRAEATAKERLEQAVATLKG